MKVTFDNMKEEFVYYATRAIKAKEEGDTELYLDCLARASELMHKLKNDGELEKIKKDETNIVPR